MSDSNVVPILQKKLNLQEKDDLIDAFIDNALKGNLREREQLLNIYGRLFSYFLRLVDENAATYDLLRIDNCSTYFVIRDAQAFNDLRHEFYKLLIESQTGKKQFY